MNDECGLSHMAYMSGIDAGGAGRNEGQCR